MSEKTIWTHGCDNCGADEPVEDVSPLGYLCAKCRDPETLRELLLPYFTPRQPSTKKGGET